METGDGTSLAALFTLGGSYEIFYGLFQDATPLPTCWKTGSGATRTIFFRHVRTRFRYRYRHGYARGHQLYVRNDDISGKRVALEGMSQFRLEGDLIREYREVFSAGTRWRSLIWRRNGSTIFSASIQKFVRKPGVGPTSQAIRPLESSFSEQ